MISVMEEQQIAWQATPYRAPVLDAEGGEIGRTASLLGDEEADIFHGIAVRVDGGRRRVEISADQIERITNLRVHTSVAQADVADLPPYREEHWYHLGWGGLFRKREEWREDG